LSFIYKKQLGTFLTNPQAFRFLNSIDECYSNLLKPNIIHENFHTVGFIDRSHSIYRAACATALAGQHTETFILIRPIIENAAIALNIHVQPSLSEVFDNRHNPPDGLSNSKDAFQNKNLQNVIKQINPNIGNAYKIIYDYCVDFGSHPNPGSFYTGMELKKDSNTVGILYSSVGDEKQARSLKILAQAGLCGLRIYQLILYEKFRQLGIDSIITATISDLK